MKKLINDIVYDRIYTNTKSKNIKIRQKYIFYINNYDNPKVFNFIKSHISYFDKQFFKELIIMNNHATHWSNNCFEIMPIEYIDTEICNLAILRHIDCYDNYWFLTIYKRKSEVLTEDLWKLGARLYSNIRDGENNFLNITPNQYKDEEYYKEMCRHSFRYYSVFTQNKKNIMSTVPQKILTVNFLISLLKENINNLDCFDNFSLEKEITYILNNERVKQKIWQYAIKLDGKAITYIELNDERIKFFLNTYDKDSREYCTYFKWKCKKYKKAKLNTTPQYNNTEDNTNINNQTFIPITFLGKVPDEYKKDLDSEEYLEVIYKLMGIKIINKYDNLFYKTILPESWEVINNGYWNYRTKVKINFD